MDLRQYYKKLHAMESGIPDANVLVVSLETVDGGKAGVITEAPRRNACQLVLDGRARLAKPEEAAEYREAEARKRAEFERAKKASTVRVQFVRYEAPEQTAPKGEE